MQDPKEIEESYREPDPWGFKTNRDDQMRKNLIVTTLQDRYRLFLRALDLGCGEAWITQSLPAIEKFGFELSSMARARFPEKVKAVLEPEGEYDLVVATGVLYAHYDYPLFFDLIRQHASKVLLTCNIKSWERPELNNPEWMRDEFGMKEVMSSEFPYREFTQKLRIFEKRGKK